MADAEKKPLSIAETIEAYARGGEVPAIEMTEEQKKEMIAFLEEEKKKAIAFLEEQRRKDYGEKKQEILPPSAK